MRLSTLRYGEHPAQFGELYRPDRALHHGVVVIVHGGFWRAAHDLGLGRPLAHDLAAHGYTCWNLEYRRVGAGGGWPATLDDVANGIDALADADIDTSAVVAVGHSAGGHLAVWAAGRDTLPVGAPGATPRVTLRAAVSQGGVLDLVVAQRTGVGAGAPAELLGGGPDDVPDRYRVADPIAVAPLRAPVLCVHARADDAVPYEQSERYVAAARAGGAAAALIEVPGDHMTLIAPASPAWHVVRESLPHLLAGRLPPAATDPA